jgi:signal transduction histidine kinase
MNRMWIRISLQLVLIVFMILAIVLATTSFLPRVVPLRRFVETGLREPGGLVDQLSEYYQTHQSWDNVTAYLDASTDVAFLPNGPGGFRLNLADAGGTIIYGAQFGQRIDLQTQSTAIPVVVENRIRGYLLLTEITPFTLEQGITGRWTGQILGLITLVTLIVSIISIIAGVLFSRSLTRPLTQLAEAARAIGARNLRQRVEVDRRATLEVTTLANEFNDMATQLEQAEKLRSNLVADVAHELRTPLSVLQGNLRALIDDVYPLTKTEVMHLYDQTRLLARLVNDLHELSQAEAHQLPLHKRNIEVERLIEQQRDIFAPTAEAEGIQLVVDVPPQLPSVHADPTRLTQVISNLVMNAITHTPQNGTVRIRASGSSDLLCIEVSDTGEGIAPDHLPYVFERFYRADASRNRNTGGAGLGLAIVKALVEAHNGSISVHSAGKGKGTTFSVSLPVSSSS